MTTTTDTLSTAKPVNTELEAKRQAVLASMKRKKSSQNSSKDGSPVLVNPPVRVGNSSLKNSQGVKSQLYDAVLDLRSFGYSLERIAQESGISRDFLIQCYNEWKFPIPKAEPIILENNTSINLRSNSNTPTFIDKSASSTPAFYQRPMFNSKVYRANMEKPEWLNNLVIDLEDSSEEESDDEEEEEEEDQERVESQQEVIKEVPKSEVKSSDEELISKVEEQIVKKRKLPDNELETAKNKKIDLKTEIKNLSNEIKVRDKEASKTDSSVEDLNLLLKERKNQLSWLEKETKRIATEAKEIEALIQGREKESKMLLEMKSQLADKLVELDEQEKEESRLLQAEQRRLLLKEKLLQQMKSKKQQQQQDPEKSVTVSPKPVKQDEKENYDSVSSDVVEKSPKVINSIFFSSGKSETDPKAYPVY